MAKWEYCAVGPLGPDLQPIREKQGDINILYITREGVDLRTFTAKQKDLRAHVSNLIAYLGDEGWEIVGVGTTQAAAGAYAALAAGLKISHMLYFKRAKE